MRDYIGIVIGKETRRIYSLVNPDDDAELDDPCHLELIKPARPEPVELIRLRRDRFHHPDNEISPIRCIDEITPDDCYHLMIRWYVEASEVYHGPDIIVGAI